MKRTNTALKTIAMAGMALAISAGPAAASTGYPSITRSIPPAAAQHQADYTSINGTLGAAPSNAASNATVHSSLNSIVGAKQPAPDQAAVTVVREDSGFNWGDAFVGAAGALALALLSLATVRTLRRREGVKVA
jgi:hypothetical protein